MEDKIDNGNWLIGRLIRISRFSKYYIRAVPLFRAAFGSPFRHIETNNNFIIVGNVRAENVVFSLCITSKLNRKSVIKKSVSAFEQTYSGAFS